MSSGGLLTLQMTSVEIMVCRTAVRGMRNGLRQEATEQGDVRSVSIEFVEKQLKRVDVVLSSALPPVHGVISKGHLRSPISRLILTEDQRDLLADALLWGLRYGVVNVDQVVQSLFSGALNRRRFRSNVFRLPLGTNS